MILPASYYNFLKIIKIKKKFIIKNFRYAVSNQTESGAEYLRRMRRAEDFSKPKQFDGGLITATNKV